MRAVVIDTYDAYINGMIGRGVAVLVELAYNKNGKHYEGRAIAAVHGGSIVRMMVSRDRDLGPINEFAVQAFSKLHEDFTESKRNNLVFESVEKAKKNIARSNTKRKVMDTLIAFMETATMNRELIASITVDKISYRFQDAKSKILENPK